MTDNTPAQAPLSKDGAAVTPSRDGIWRAIDDYADALSNLRKGVGSGNSDLDRQPLHDAEVEIDARLDRIFNTQPASVCEEVLRLRAANYDLEQRNADLHEIASQRFDFVEEQREAAKDGALRESDNGDGDPA